MFIEYTKVLLARVQILRDYLASDKVDPKNSLNLCPCISIVRREFNVNISNRVLARLSRSVQNQVLGERRV